MDNGISANVKHGDTWLRGLYMLLFVMIYSLAEIVVTAVVIFQFVSKVITGGVNERLLAFGQHLSTYIYQTMLFFTFNSEEKPFPFRPWPQGSTPATNPAETELPPFTSPESSSDSKASDLTAH